MKRSELSDYRSLPRGYYHLCTDGWKTGKLFHTVAQYALGMATIALITLKFDVQIYVFELMPNHIHIILSATGAQCVDVFSFIRQRINKRLKAEGYPELPPDYGFKLVPIESKEALQKQVLYLARNAYEKGLCTPCGHMWGSSYLLYNQLAQFILGEKVKDMPVRKVERLIESRIPLPPEWEIHPVLGVLPSNFVKLDKVLEVFPNVKDYMTMMIKDYESYVRISNALGEELEWSVCEVKDITGQVVRNTSRGRSLNELSNEEKCQVAVRIHHDYGIAPKLLAQAVYIPERVIMQAIRSKDYGIKD